ncbi:MAG: HNH endonuclease [Pseudorhodoplanes sp.]|nr:HNH endonuclease [Pseudorhodoplanes sp.]
MSWLDWIQKALLNLGGIAALPKLYVEIGNLRNKPLSHTDQATVRKEIERHSSDSEVWQEKQGLFFSIRGVGRGVWGLRSAIPASPVANDSAGSNDLPEGQKNPTRKKTFIFRIIRDTEVTKALKKLHSHECQLCKTTITLGDGSAYSEAHHIRPLGNPHRGPDTPENIIVVCPNCHVLMDYFAINLDPKKFTSRDGHKISPEFVNYHNDHHAKLKP